MCNRFACLLVEPIPDDDCADPTDCPDPSFNSSSVSSSHGSHPAVLLILEAENSGNLSLFHSIQSPTSLDKELSLSSSFCPRMMLTLEFVRLWLLLMA